MGVFDRYLFKNLLVATFFVALTLTCVILLTQSLRFLELVINSGASSVAFWILTFLAMPRFLEIILPIALMAATVFIYNKMTIDSELVVMRTLGRSPFALARPALILASMVTVIMLVVTMWAAPLSISQMQQLRQIIKTQYSSWLFQPGVFNSVVPGLTVYVREKAGNGELRGLMINDSRDPKVAPSTIIAKRGVVMQTDTGGQQVLVFDGSRQVMEKGTEALSRLDFSRYTVDLPEESGPVRQRWREPDERTLFELLKPDLNSSGDRRYQRDFMVELHRRIVSPVLAPCYVVVVLAFLLLGPIDRRGQGWRIVFAIAAVVAIQGLYLAAANGARESNFGLALMYILAFLPLGTGLFLLSSTSEGLRQKLLFRRNRRGTAS